MIEDNVKIVYENYMHRRRITDKFQINSSKALLNEVISILYLILPSFQTKAIRRVFNSVTKLYNGKFPGYRKCNTGYHDLRHAQEAFLAMARLIHGAVLNGERFSESEITAGLSAAILHDVGYIQEEKDIQGTGAKYKANHEQRSMEFLKLHGEQFGLSSKEIASGCSMIACTDMDEDIAAMSFPSPKIEMLGKLLASADLTAQLSDQTYLEKLLFLYREYREAGDGSYKSETDILKKALPFYDLCENRLTKFKNEADRYLTSHFALRSKIDNNLYREAIKKHKHYLQKILSIDGADPRKLMRRSGIVETVRRRYGNEG